MSDQISRRDFLNGMLLASGGLLVSQSIPLRALAASQNTCDGSIGQDPRALRGGNLPSTYLIAHWMRDRRLTFGSDYVQLAKGCDSKEGKFQVETLPEKYDVIICGSGLSGLSSAFYLLRRRPKTRILILDGNPWVGGNAGRDDQPPLSVISATGGAYAVPPYAPFQKEIYGQIGIDWEKYKIQDPLYSYYFDEQTPGIKKGFKGWVTDAYGTGLKRLPYSPEVIQQILRCKEEFKKWGELEGAPTDPSDQSHPRYDSFSQITLHDYLIHHLKCDPIVSDFFTRYTIDALGGTAQQVNAHSSISFLGAEFGSLFAFPGGNSGIVRHLIHWLIPQALPGKTSEDSIHNSIRTEMLDHKDHNVRIRQNSVVIRADQTPNESSVLYYKDGKFLKVHAKSVILAGQSHTAQHLVEHLVSQDRKDAWKKVKMVPVVVANVGIKNSDFIAELGLGYNQYWWGSKYWADFVTADWATPHRKKKGRPTVLTFFGGNTASAEELPGERYKLLNTPFGDYEKSLREDTARIFEKTSFQFDRDVTSIQIYRWGHGMLMPVPGSIFGESKDPTQHAPCYRHKIRAQLGRISFAGQDTEGTPSVESALYSGLRATEEVMPLLS